MLYSPRREKGKVYPFISSNVPKAQLECELSLNKIEAEVNMYNFHLLIFDEN